MRALVLLAALVPACGFSAPGVEPDLDAGVDGMPDGPDAPIDAPPASPLVTFESITPDITMLYPGMYGWHVTATLRNDSDVPLTDVAPRLTFATGAMDRAAQFRVRSKDRRDGVMLPPVTTIPARGEATYEFVVDAYASAAPPGPVEINGVATAVAAGEPVSATPLAEPALVPFATLPDPIVVNTATDDIVAGNDLLSLREAMVLAGSMSGFDRIVFDPQVFPVGADPVTQILLEEANLELVGVNHDLVIDASNVDVVLAVDAGWGTLPGRVALRHTGGRLVVHGLRFRNFAYGYPATDVSTDNCAGGDRGVGGAIVTTNGTLILQSNVFSDPDVAERNCYQAAVELLGGTAHRISNNVFSGIAADALYINASVADLAHNSINGGATPRKGDDGIFIHTQGGMPLWLVGNIIVDQEVSAVISGASNPGPTYLANNVFARNARAVQLNGAAALELRNNVYASQVLPAIVCPDGSTGALDLASETLLDNLLMEQGDCGMPVIDQATMLTTSDLGIAMPVMPVGRADFTPQPGSPLVSAGAPGLDRNGNGAGWANGTGPERGAVELP